MSIGVHSATLDTSGGSAKANLRFSICGAASAVPEHTLDNVQLAEQLGTTAESIEARTGIVSRRVASAGESASSLGARAASAALARSGVCASEIDLVLLSTYTPDHLLCPTAPRIAELIGATRAGAFDLNGACAGGGIALTNAAALLNSLGYRYVLVVCADITTQFIRQDDPKARLVFGDGASAMVIGQPDADDSRPNWTLIASEMGCDGTGAEHFYAAHRSDSIEPIKMNGRAIFRFGVEKAVELLDNLADTAGIPTQDVTWVVPHQANLRMIRSMIERSGVPESRWAINIRDLGNTASSSVLIALGELMALGRPASGETVALLGFGAGLTWAGSLFQVD